MSHLTVGRIVDLLARATGGRLSEGRNLAAERWLRRAMGDYAPDLRNMTGSDPQTCSPALW